MPSKIDRTLLQEALDASASYGTALAAAASSHTGTSLKVEVIVNGSLKGADEYSFQSNFDFEIPQQAMWITHKEWGITASWPIKLEKPGVKFL